MMDRIDIVTATGERGTFRLTFRLDRGSTLTTPGGARISVTGAEVFIDNGHGASIALIGNKVHITGVIVS